MLILRTPCLMASLNLGDRYAVGLFHLAAELVDQRQQSCGTLDEPCMTKWVFGMRLWISLTRLIASTSPVGGR